MTGLLKFREHGRADPDGGADVISESADTLRFRQLIVQSVKLCVLYVGRLPVVIAVRCVRQLDFSDLHN